MQKTLPKVSVIVLNYNGRDHLDECLSSLSELEYPDYEVIVVDNDSGDESVRFVKDNFDWVKLVELDKNYGFAEGNNRGVENANGKFVAFLNNDTRVDRKWLSELVRVMDSDEHIGMCGSKMLMYHRPDFINSAGQHISLISGYFWNRGEFEKDRGQYEEETEVVSICAGAMMIRKSVFDEVGGFKKELFIYYDDVDLSIKCWIYGYSVVYAPKSIVYHKVGATTKEMAGHKNEKLERNRGRFTVYLLERNRWYMYLTKFSLPSLVIFLPVFLSYFLFITLGLFVMELLSKQEYSRTRVHLSALWYNIKNLPAIMSDRSRIQKERRRNDWSFLRFGRLDLIPARKTREWNSVEN